jgi:protein TonB
MPKIEPEEEEPVEQTAAARPAEIAPPMQTDVPQLATDTSFVQKLEPPPPEGMAVDRSAIVVPAGAGGYIKGGQVFDPSMLDQQPVATYQAHPVYPYDMKKQGISGNVNVEFVLTPDGSVRNAFVLSSTQHEFEAAAIQAVSKWRFHPGRRGGRAVNTRMQVEINFRLDSPE